MKITFESILSRQIHVNIIQSFVHQTQHCLKTLCTLSWFRMRSKFHYLLEVSRRVISSSRRFYLLGRLCHAGIKPTVGYATESRFKAVYRHRLDSIVQALVNSASRPSRLKTRLIFIIRKWRPLAVEVWMALLRLNSKANKAWGVRMGNGPEHNPDTLFQMVASIMASFCSPRTYMTATMLTLCCCWRCCLCFSMSHVYNDVVNIVKTIHNIVYVYNYILYK